MRYFRLGDNAAAAGWFGASALMVVGCLLVFAPARATDSHWTIASAEGTAILILNGSEEVAATQGYPVEAGATLITGVDGMVTLVRRGDSVTMHPNSEMTVPDTVSGDRMGVLQNLGRLLFRMETRESRNFEVRTPFLAATVKGTVFTVEVAADQATVTVTEGSVLVAPVRGGRSELVDAGNRASVKATSANKVDVEKVAGGPSPNGNDGQMHGKPAGGDPRDPSSKGNSQGGASQGGASQGGASPGGDSRSGDSQGAGAQGNGARGNER